MKRNRRFWCLGLTLLALLLVFGAAVVGTAGTAGAGLIYDISGGNALVKGQADVEGELDANRISTHEVVVGSYTQLENFGGVSVFRVDLSQHSEVKIDLAAIYDSVLEDISTGLTPWANAFSGVSVIADDVDEKNDRVVWAVSCIGVDTSGATPVEVWAPRNSGNTAYAQPIRGFGASSEWITGASVWQIDDQGDRCEFMNDYLGGASIYEIDRMIGS